MPEGQQRDMRQGSLVYIFSLRSQIFHNVIDFDGTEEYLQIASRFGLGANPAYMAFAVTLTDAVTASNHRFWQIGDDDDGIISGAVGTGHVPGRHGGPA